MGTITELEMIKASAFDQDELLRLAFLDCVQSLAQHTCCNRTPAESLRLLANWTRTFQKMEKRP